MHPPSLRALCGFAIVSLTLCATRAQTKPFVHPLFSSDMALQREALDPVWGWTMPGAQVTVSINGQTKPAVPSGSGLFNITTLAFSPQKARYLKSTQTGSTANNWLSIRELKVYGYTE